MREIWKDIYGYENIYQVSNLGRIKRLKTITTTGTGNYNREEHIVKPFNNNKGYKLVWLYKNGAGKEFLVHRLVAIAFIENPNNYKVINHKDENKKNNCVDNLEWCTQKYNLKPYVST